MDIIPSWVPATWSSNPRLQWHPWPSHAKRPAHPLPLSRRAAHPVSSCFRLGAIETPSRLRLQRVFNTQSSARMEFSRALSSREPARHGSPRTEKEATFEDLRWAWQAHGVTGRGLVRALLRSAGNPCLHRPALGPHPQSVPSSARVPHN